MADDNVRSPGTKPDERPDIAINVEEDERVVGDPMAAIRQRFQIMQTFWSEIHSIGLEDDRFVAGEQWMEQIRKERQEDRRPILTYNLMPSFTRQITNRIRQERPQVKVTPIETNRGRDPRLKNIAGTKDYSMGDVYTGIIKNIEHVSRADQAYDTAVKHAVDHGFGYFYLMNQWSKLDPFVQELRIHRVKNSYSIMLDPDAQEADYRDAQDGFMFTNIRKETFKQKYPDATFTEFASTSMGANYEGWYDTDHVRIAQYFWIDYLDDEALMLSNGKLVYLRDVEDVLDDLEHETGVHIAMNEAGTELRKKVKRPVCKWQKMTADEVVEGPLDLPFSSIPIFPVLGEEVMVDARIRYESAIRHAKDAQRSYNYWRTAATESVALAPRAPWVATERQMAGHEELYEQANTRNLPFLVYNHVDGVPPPQRNAPPMPAAAELQNAIQDGVDMQTIIGLHDASLGRESNEKSGKAIIARQNAGATATFQFPDNLGRALEQMGRCIVEAVPKLYDTQRIIRIRMPDDTNDFVEINTAIEDADTGKTVLVHDIAYGKYDVALETGPSYATMRQEAADLQMELLKVLPPEAAANIVHLIVQNLGVPGSEEVARVLRKMLPEGLKSEEEKMADLPQGVSKNPETGQLENEDGTPYQPELSPDMQVLQKQNQIEEAKVQALQAKADAEVQTAQAKTKQAEADLAEANAKLAELQAQGAGPAFDQDGMTRDLTQAIQDTMQKHQDDPNAHAAMNIEQKIADAIVDALKRVRGYVDRTAKKGGEQEAAAGNGSAPAPSTGNGGGGPLEVNLNLEPKPDEIEFEYNDSGDIVKAVPVYNGEDSPAESD